MENEITMTGSVRQYRLVSRFLIAKYIILFIPLLLVLLMALSLFVAGEPVIALGPLMVLLIYGIQLIRASRKLAKETPHSFTVSSDGINFT